MLTFLSLPLSAFFRYMVAYYATGRTAVEHCEMSFKTVLGLGRRNCRQSQNNS
jgi:hypothetical protein